MEKLCGIWVQVGECRKTFLWPFDKCTEIIINQSGGGKGLGFDEGQGDEEIQYVLDLFRPAGSGIIYQRVTVTVRVVGEVVGISLGNVNSPSLFTYGLGAHTSAMSDASRSKPKL